jgi:tripartite-type tricarboxylate transporter receptor subunit TctC
LIATGKLRGLAVTAPQRVAGIRDVPSVVEQGFPNLVLEDYVGYAVKSGTPKDVVARLNDAINRALQKAKVRDAFATLGATAAGGTPTEFGKTHPDSNCLLEQRCDGFRHQDAAVIS